MSKIPNLKKFVVKALHFINKILLKRKFNNKFHPQQAAGY